MYDDISALAYVEAQRLLENYFTFDNPYTCVIDISGVPSDQEEEFYQMVENELLLRGEKIKRSGAFFKIPKFQRAEEE